MLCRRNGGRSMVKTSEKSTGLLEEAGQAVRLGGLGLAATR